MRRGWVGTLDGREPASTRAHAVHRGDGEGVAHRRACRSTRGPSTTRPSCAGSPSSASTACSRTIRHASRVRRRCRLRVTRATWCAAGSTRRCRASEPPEPPPMPAPMLEPAAAPPIAPGTAPTPPRRRAGDAARDSAATVPTPPPTSAPELPQRLPLSTMRVRVEAAGDVGERSGSIVAKVSKSIALTDSPGGRLRSIPSAAHVPALAARTTRARAQHRARG